MKTLHFLLFRPVFGPHSTFKWLALRLRQIFRKIFKHKEKQTQLVEMRKVAPAHIFNSPNSPKRKPSNVPERQPIRNRSIRRKTKKKSIMFDFGESEEEPDFQKVNLTNDSDIFDRLSEDVSDFEEHQEDTPKQRK